MEAVPPHYAHDHEPVLTETGPTTVKSPASSRTEPVRQHRPGTCHVTGLDAPKTTVPDGEQHLSEVRILPRPARAGGSRHQPAPTTPNTATEPRPAGPDTSRPNDFVARATRAALPGPSAATECRDRMTPCRLAHAACPIGITVVVGVWRPGNLPRSVRCCHTPSTPGAGPSI